MTYKVGDILYITITGMATVCKTRVVKGGTLEKPYIQVLGIDDESSPVWPTLKPKDYVIWPRQKHWGKEYKKSLKRGFTYNMPSKKMAIKYGILFFVILVFIIMIFCIVE